MSDHGETTPLRVGSRGSALALAQAERVIALLRERAPTIEPHIEIIRTQGDIDRTSSLNVIGGRGVFTSALQEALARHQVDVAVHSAKDLPPLEPPGLIVAAFPEREDPRDVFVSRHGLSLGDLPPGPKIGTSSRRRSLQVRLLRPDAVIVDLRGNVDTRLRKAMETDLDGIVLAAAGVVRMGWVDRVTEWLPLDRFLPAPGQGALAVEARADDTPTLALLATIVDPDVTVPVEAERTFLRELGAGCTTPVGAHVRREDGLWVLRAMHATDDDEPVWIERALSVDGWRQEAAAAAREIAALAERRVFPPPGGQLAGLRVVVTRASEQAGSLVEALRAEGAEPMCLPTIRIAEPEDPAPFVDALRAAASGQFDWLAITSVNGAARVAAALRTLGCDGAGLRCRIAAVGESTAAALRAEKLEPDLIAPVATAEGLAAALIDAGAVGKRTLHPTSDIARDALERQLRTAGASVERVVAYRTVPEEPNPETLAMVKRGDYDMAVFASPSSMRNFFALLDGETAGLRRARIVCVGPVTAVAVRELGLPVHAEAADASVPGLVDAVMQARSMTRDNTPVGVSVER
ncbi:MAG: hydroxymethylbilane synthase [Thermomicrobiales bacterium]|nr:hydroxymethylbilane synthase [Thermomicrobiales bacterium]